MGFALQPQHKKMSVKSGITGTALRPRYFFILIKKTQSVNSNPFFGNK